MERSVSECGVSRGSTPPGEHSAARARRRPDQVRSGLQGSDNTQSHTQQNIYVYNKFRILYIVFSDLRLYFKSCSMSINIMLLFCLYHFVCTYSYVCFFKFTSSCFYCHIVDFEFPVCLTVRLKLKVCLKRRDFSKQWSGLEKNKTTYNNKNNKHIKKVNTRNK